jgi:flagellar biosynthesis activator protein FlaF
MSINAYKTTIRQSESPRQIERRILVRLTGALEAHAAYDKLDSSVQRIDILAKGLRDALAENQKFWSELKHDLSQPENQLPPNLRAGLLSLALWIDKHTAAVLGGQTGVMALVEVNRAIITGLATSSPAAAPVAVVPAATGAQPMAEPNLQAG